MKKEERVCQGVTAVGSKEGGFKRGWVKKRVGSKIARDGVGFNITQVGQL
jgi:hypothetical protein